MSVINPEQLILTPRPHVAADFDNYHTAPLLLSGPEARQDLIDNQNRLLQQFVEAALYEISRYSTEDVARYGAERISTRIHQVEGMNANIYNFERLYKNANLDVGRPEISRREVARACKLAKVGLGTMRQNELTLEAYKMPSAGLGELTVIGELRRELDVPMWEEASELVGSDATPKFEQMTNLRVLGFHQKEMDSGALRISMKRNLGTLSTGTEVKSRTIALINTDPSYGLDQGDLEEILQGVVKIDSAKNRVENIQNVDMSRNAAFMRVLEWLVEEEMKPGTVLARNESIYASNPVYQAQVAARRQATL
jgi:hypothetical protein